MDKAVESRKYDVIIWGATGFTGELIVEHYAAHAPRTLRWAIAGRDKDKLQQILSKHSINVDVLTANIKEASSIESLVAQATVVVSCVGPYAQYGTPIVDACVKVATHYVDITGEFWWVHDIIEKYDTEARKKHLIILPACGFDSVPSDLGAFYTVNLVKDEMRKDCGKVKNFVSLKGGQASGGTVRTLLLASKNPQVLRMRQEVYALNPPDKKTGRDRLPGLRYDKEEKSWSVPFFMEACNARVVRRSAALLDYGDEFCYDELSKMSFFWALLVTVFMPIAFFLAGFSFIQSFITKMVPAGPSKATMSKSKMSMNFVADVGSGTDRTKFRTQFQYDGDGYLFTAIAAGEAAIALVEQRDSLAPGGVLTPASAMGDVLIKRLEKLGAHFSKQDKKAR